MNISPTAKKIIVAALHYTTPVSIASATQLTVQAVYANLTSLKKNNLAVYNSEEKTLTLTKEGIRVANEEEVETAAVVANPVSIPAGTIRGTKTEQAEVLIVAMLTADPAARRKDIVLAIANSLQVEKNNASAYYQNYRKRHGLVVPKVASTDTEVGLGVDEMKPTEVEEPWLPESLVDAPAAEAETTE